MNSEIRCADKKILAYDGPLRKINCPGEKVYSVSLFVPLYRCVMSTTSANREYPAGIHPPIPSPTDDEWTRPNHEQTASGSVQ